MFNLHMMQKLPLSYSLHFFPHYMKHLLTAYVYPCSATFSKPYNFKPCTIQVEIHILLLVTTLFWKFIALRQNLRQGFPDKIFRRILSYVAPPAHMSIRPY